MHNHCVCSYLEKENKKCSLNYGYYSLLNHVHDRNKKK